MACDCEKKGLIIKGQLELNLSADNLPSNLTSY
jgi:hypothetical protein